MGDPRREAVLVLNRAARALGDGSQTSASASVHFANDGKDAARVLVCISDALGAQGFNFGRLAVLPVSEQRRMLEDAAEELSRKLQGRDASSPAVRGRERGRARGERFSDAAELERLRRENIELGLQVEELKTELAEARGGAR